MMLIISHLYRGGGGDFIRPNVSYVKETHCVHYNPLLIERGPLLKCTFNATPDNLVAFTNVSNIKSLKVNGTSIEFEPIKNEITTFDVLGENISLDIETSAATFPDSYLIKSPVTSWSFKAKDPNYVLNENAYICMLGMMDGTTMAQPMPIMDVMGQYFTTNDGVTLELVDSFLAEMNMQIQSGGVQVGFTLMDVDMNNQTFMFIDTEHQTNVTTGGLPIYSFDSEGLHDVEIELSDSVMKDIRFNGNSLISIEIGDGITYIESNVFANCFSLNEIICKGNIAPQIQNNTFGNQYDHIKKFGVLTVPDNADYSSWLSTSSYYLGYYGWIYSNTPVYDLVCAYNVDNISNSTKLYTSTNFNPYMMIINDEKLEASSDYKFNEIGQYEVIYRFLTPITEIKAETFSDCSGLTSITIGKSVTTIGDYAFTDCTSLTSIVIPDSVTSIDERAFQNCTGLTSITIGKSVTTIGDYAFTDCTSLTSITIPDSVTTIGSGAFRSCSSLTNMNIGSGVTEIGSYAFHFCSRLTGITIPDSVTSIGYGAFQNCTSLTSVYIGSEGVTSIDGYAFHDCTSLTSVTLGSGVTSIGASAFSGCSGLTGELVIPDSVKTIGTSAFYDCTSLTSVTLGSGVTSIGSAAFIGCYSLTSITIPDSVTSIGDHAFQNCTGLTDLAIGTGVTIISDGAFVGCSGLTGELVIPDSVNTIGAYAFKNCRDLTSVTIGSGVTSIGDNAFYDCTGLTGELVIPDSVKTIGSYVFHNCSGLTGELVIPSGLTYIDYGTFRNCSGLTSVVIPNGVTEIGNWAFDECTGLTSINIPNSVTSIGISAFADCTGLTEVVIPDSVTEIDSFAFADCSGLTSITSYAPTVPSIQIDTFHNIKEGGVLKVPEGSDYSSWMSTSDYYLGKYNWTVQYI